MPPVSVRSMPGHIWAQVIDLGYASRRVHDQIGCDLGHLLGAAIVRDQFVSAPLDRRDGRAQPYVDAEIACDLDELSNEISVESLQRTVAAVENRYLGACASGDLRELEGDVPAPTKATRRGNCSRSRNSVLVVRCSSPCIASGACAPRLR